jgi:thymidylate synthase
MFGYNERTYLNMVRYIIGNGEQKTDRTGVGTISVFGHHVTYKNVADDFPLLTTKKMPWKSIVAELLWFLEGSKDERRLAELTYGKPREELVDKRTIWTDNALEQGYKLYGEYYTPTYRPLGAIYGVQWRGLGNSNTKDQIFEVIESLKKDPNSRRHIVTAWVPNDIDSMTLPPCHMMFQFYVRQGKYLDCQMYQRSADSGLGIPFNIASYSLLMMIIAREIGLKAGHFHHVIGDAHIYTNHMDALLKQLERTPMSPPVVEIDPGFSLYQVIYQHGEFGLKDVDRISLRGYNHHPSIKMVMAV